MTIDETNTILKMLNGMYRHANLGAENLEGYHLMLADVPYETVKAGLPSLLSLHPDFVPSAPAMRNHFLGSVEDEYAAQLPTGKQAWEEIFRFIKSTPARVFPRFSHPLIERTARAFGWEELRTLEQNDLPTVRAQVERFHDGYRADAIALLKRGTPMEFAIASWAEQSRGQARVAGLMPVALPGDDEDEWAEAV